MIKPFLPTVAIAAALALSCAPSVAQCQFSWLPGAPTSGPNGSVFAMLRQGNGDILAGGDFTLADDQFAQGMARFDGTSWHRLGQGIDGVAYAVTELPNGTIVVGGTFAMAGGSPANNIAAWNGTSWTALGSGLAGRVNALLVMPNGDLLAGGLFPVLGSQQRTRVARWNGSNWSAVGNTFGDPARALALAPNGDLLMAAFFSSSTSFSAVGRWDGSTWTQEPTFGSGSSNTTLQIRAIEQRSSNEYILAGSFQIGGTSVSLVSWDGTSTTLTPLSPPVVGPITTVHIADNGDVLAGSPASSPNLARWDGANWTSIAGARAGIQTIAERANGDLLVSGTALADESAFVRQWDGLAWQSTGANEPPVTKDMLRLRDGNVIVAGKFSSLEGTQANNVAIWNGTSWSPLGTGVNGTVTKLAEAPNGDIIVAGSFSQAGGTPANRIARWNGQAWSTIGGGPGITATQLAVTSNGDIFAAQGALLRRFDGLNWSTLAPSAPTILAATFSLAALPNGSLSIGGFFIGAGGIPGVTGAMLYQNGSFSPLPGLPVTGLPGSRQFVTSEGDLIINFFASMHRWNGSTWTELPGLSTGPLAELPNGELIACSPATPPLGHTQSSFAYRLRNGAWEQFANVGAGAARIAVADDGDLFVGGPMTTVDGEISVGFGHALPSCRATAVSAGAGCVGGAGPVTLQSNNLPWSGGVYRATADGMTAQSLALQLFGVQSTAQSLPLGAPGCSLLTVPFLTTLEVPSNGSAAMTFELPSNAILIGQQLRQQVVGFELGGAGIVRLTSSNALDLVIGAL